MMQANKAMSTAPSAQSAQGRQGKPGKQGTSSLLKILVTVVAVIVVVLYVSAGLAIKESSESYSIDYDARDYVYPAENGRYGDLYYTAIEDMRKTTTYTAEVEECRALAFYYEQAVLEHAYRAAGDTAKADEFAKRMEEYESQLGSMSSRAQAVRDAVLQG